jgi:hypothetical protein
MSYRVIFWDATETKLTVGSAKMEQVPVPGDSLTLRRGSQSLDLKVKSRRLIIDDVDDEPKAKAPYPEAHVFVEVMGTI